MSNRFRFSHLQAILCTVAHKRKKLAKPVKVRVFPGSFGFHASASRTAKANEQVLRAWETVQTFHGTDTDSEEAIRKAWGAYQRAVIKLVREDKRALYFSPHVRRCIDQGVMSGDKDFFSNLGDVLPAGVGLDRRIEKQLPLVRKADGLRRKGRKWSEIADLIDPDCEQGLDAESIRILVRRYKRLNLV
jgi:hypothetical protein